MNNDLHQDHNLEHLDLTQLEEEPGALADPLFVRQTDNIQLAGPWFRAHFSSDTPVHSPTSTATALLKLTCAAALPATAMAAAGKAMGATAWLTLTLAAALFLIVEAVGLFLILRIEPTSHAPHHISPQSAEEQTSPVELGVPRHSTAQRHPHHPTPPPRALQPPRHR